ncbi:MAG: succinylglutamate desuccinylase/aspartoacylase family protein [Myxococcota bacterium]|nr:succinylglutamate desuccinylase/aspartoacylase family protein [Myxococcota bacterium]
MSQLRRCIGLILLLGLVAHLPGCRQLGLGVKYFLTPCAGDGPERNADFELNLPPLDLDAFYAELRALEATFDVEEVGRVRYRGRDDPQYWIRRPGPEGAPRMLIVAGVHGDERAALLAVPRVLAELAAERSTQERVGAPHWDLSVLLPVNPVGLAHTSRYNAAGCDLNRDFGDFANEETRTVREVVERLKPDLVVAPHEGPQDGFFLIATADADPELAHRAVDAVANAGIPLARKSFLGLALGSPGLSLEGARIAAAKRWLGLGSLGTYMESLGVGTLTTESSWDSEDFGARIRSHVIAIQAILASQPPGVASSAED